MCVMIENSQKTLTLRFVRAVCTGCPESSDAFQHFADNRDWFVYIQELVKSMTWDNKPHPSAKSSFDVTASAAMSASTRGRKPLQVLKMHAT